MKKIALALAFLLGSISAWAQTVTTYYTAPTVAAVKALTTRPAVIEIVDSNPGVFNWVAGSSATADDIMVINPTSGPSGRYVRLATPYAVGKSATTNGVLTTDSSGYPSITSRSSLTGTVMVDWYYSGSGSHDAAIAAAIAACPASGCAIGFTPGTYYATNIAVNRGNIRFFCTGLRSCNIQNTSTTGDLFSVNLTVATTTVSTTNSSATATVASASGLAVGQQVNSANIPAGTTILNIVGTTLTLSANATATASGTSATFGSMVYDVYWDNLVFSSQNTASAGCQINARNLVYAGVLNSRFYGNETAWKHVCLRAVNDFAFDNVQSDNPQNAHVTLEGITTKGYGTLDGTFIGLTIRNYSYFIGGHAVTASPLNHGSIEIGDLAGGLFFDTAVIARPRGYAVRMVGTSAGPAAGVNSLVFFNNLNVEGSGPDGESGGVYGEYYSNVNINGGWISGKGVSAVTQGANSSGWLIAGAQLVMNGSATSIVDSQGAGLSLTGNRLQSYNPGVGTGLTLASGSASVVVSGNRFEALSAGISVGTATNVDVSISGNQFYSVGTEIASAIYSWSKATISANGDDNGSLPYGAISVQGDISISRTANAANTFICLNGSAGASSACRIYLQTGTANANVTLAVNDSGGFPYFAIGSGAGIGTAYFSFNTTAFTSQAGTAYGEWNSSGLTINATKALTYGGVTLSNSVTGTGSMVLSTSPTLTTPVLGVAAATSVNFGGGAFAVTAANSVSPTSPNRTITITLGGTTYYLAAKTTND